MDISKNIKFIDICEILEKIKNAEGPHKEKHLKRYIESFQKFGTEFRKNNANAKSSFYCILRCLIPNSDTARESYGLRITTLSNIYIKILQLAVTSNEAIRLQYRSGNGANHEDYADRLYTVLRPRTTSVPSEMSLFDIHSMLDSISSDNRRGIERELTKLLETASALEQKWFIRLLLKRMNLGIGEQKIFSILHPKAKEFFTRCTDLEKVCIAIENGGDMCLDETITVFQHIRPMLCDRLKTSELYEMMNTDTIYAETKMDGERFQLHMANETFKYISRNGHDYTRYFGDNVGKGNLSPLVAGLLEPHIKSVILDGEMMVWDKEAATFRVKGENIDVKHLRVGDNLRPCFVAYDLLFLNDKSYIEVAYVERIEKLKLIFKEEPGILQIGKREKVCTLQHFTDIFNAALDANEEGVVLKMQRSTYKPGSRTGGWYKVKADYIQGLTSDMDLLIMGGSYNRSKSYIDSYLVGVIQGGQDGKVHCVGKVALGLSKLERIQLNATLLPHWKKGLSSKTLNFGELRPEVWIEPRNSVAIQVKASELGQGSSFATPYVLRFPRIEAVRADKPWHECMTLDEYEHFYKGDHGVKKINKRGLELEDVTAEKKPRTRTKNANCTDVYLTAFNPASVEAESSIFEGFNFCILSHLRGLCTIAGLKELVAKNGGKLVENPSPTDPMSICIAGDISYRVTQLRDTGLYNIVSCKWLLDTASRKRMQLKPRDLISATAEMKEQLKEMFDCSGDSYTDRIDVDELKELLTDLDHKDLPLLQQNEMHALEEEIFGQDRSPNFFRNSSAFFYNESCENLTPAVALAKIKYKWRGGECSCLSSGDDVKKISFVFADVNVVDLKALELWFLLTFSKRVLKVKVVSSRWITDCDAEGKILPVEGYLIKFNKN